MKKENTNVLVITILLSLVLLMSIFVYYSPQLYNLFCKVSGYGGYVEKSYRNSDEILYDKPIIIRLDSSIGYDLKKSVEFTPIENVHKVFLGEKKTLYYRAKNLTSKDIDLMAVYNVAPDVAAPYFNKIRCFCFEEFTLKAHEEVELPVLFFLDTELSSKMSGSLYNVTEVTLSYTLFRQ